MTKHYLTADDSKKCNFAPPSSTITWTNGTLRPLSNRTRYHAPEPSFLSAKLLEWPKGIRTTTFANAVRKPSTLKQHLWANKSRCCRRAVLRRNSPKNVDLIVGTLAILLVRDGTRFAFCRYERVATPSRASLSAARAHNSSSIKCSTYPMHAPIGVHSRACHEHCHASIDIADVGSQRSKFFITAPGVHSLKSAWNGQQGGREIRQLV
ncbi:hypothetical protein V8C44DRAFT_67235 [Trichoderma aethiopicum]